MKVVSENEGIELHLKKGSKAGYIMKVVPAYEKDEKGQIKKNDKGEYSQVIDDHGNPKIGFKWYPVFNCSSIEGIPEYQERKEEIKPFKTIQLLSSALQVRDDLKIVHTQRSKAYYSPESHLVHMPSPELFKSAGAYADTLL